MNMNDISTIGIDLGHPPNYSQAIVDKPESLPRYSSAHFWYNFIDCLWSLNKIW